MSLPVRDAPEVARLFGPGVAARACPVDPELADRLFPEEQALVARAVRKRRAEFAAGRLAARAALHALGCPDRPLGVGEDRAPLWPEGFVGSITHARDRALAAVAPADRYAGLGLDLEPDEPIEEDLFRRILRPEERAAIRAAPEEEGRLTRLVFTAKEAFFKCFFPVTGVFYGFQDVRIDLRPDGRFHASLVSPGTPPERTVRGRWIREGGFVLSAVASPLSAGAPG